MSDTSKIYAVLTGDIISSTELNTGQMETVRSTVVGAVNEIARPRSRAKIYKPEFSRGDEWQLLLDTPGHALRLALYVTANLYAKTEVRTRVAIGLGYAEKLNSKGLSLSNGEAFTLSGHALENMNRYFDLTIALPASSGLLANWIPSSLHLCSSIVRSWTRRQAEIVALAIKMDGATHKEIAKALEPARKQQSVTSVLQSANWRGLRELLEQFENTDWQNVLHHD